MQKQRNSNFELIRIIYIFIVIFWHSFSPYLDQLSRANLIPATLFNTLLNNVNLLFMLISGYFGIRFGLKKLIKLDLAIIFYDVLHLLLLGNPGPKSLAAAFMPVIFKSHWFVSCYFVIAILSGFLNMIPEKLSRKSFRNLLLTLLFLFFVIPTVFFRELIEDAGKGVVCMAIAYLIGRYIRIYFENITFRKSRLAVIFCGVTFIVMALNLTMTFIKGTYMGMYCRDNSIFMVITSVSFLLIFREIHISSRILNHLAANVVILYCIEGYVREVLNRFLDLSPYTGSLAFSGVIFLYALAVFVVCMLINELRRLILGRVDEFIAERIVRLIHTVKPHCLRLCQNAQHTVMNLIQK